ncbi:hypothetical protein [Nocardia sp. NPDC004123]
MTPIESEMLEFATAWAPYGGNDAEAFVRFGLSPKEFHARLMRLLASSASQVLTGATASTLRKQCMERLRPLRAESPAR